MKANVIHSPTETTRMESVLVVRIPTPTMVEFRTAAAEDGRTPSNLTRKLVTDFVRSRGIQAVPPATAVQTVQQDRQPSPWDI